MDRSNKNLRKVISCNLKEYVDYMDIYTYEL